MPVDLAAALSTFEEPWTPRTVATFNDYDLRVVKIRGEFTRHSHPDTDEVFLVLAESLTIRLDDSEVTLGPGQLHVIPRGVHHQPVSTAGAEVLLIEPTTTVNTGDSPGALTADRRLGVTAGRPLRRVKGQSCASDSSGEQHPDREQGDDRRGHHGGDEAAAGAREHPAQDRATRGEQDLPARRRGERRPRTPPGQPRTVDPVRAPVTSAVK